MKYNYLPWNVKLEDFYSLTSNKERISFLVNFAVLAPSSHNSQPWSFEVIDSGINIYLETSRLLPVGDKNNRQAIISIGCALENIKIAADYFGYITKIVITDTINLSSPIVSIKLFEGLINHKNDLSHLIHQITKRTVNRSKYIGSISEEIENKIKNIFKSDVMIDLISDKIKLSKIADVALNATEESMSNKLFRAELSNYVISNTSSKKFGMPGFTIGFPTLVSYFAPKMLKAFNLSNVTRKQDEPLLKLHTQLIGVISTKNDTVADWINTGMYFERLSLILIQDGISVAVWAAPIQIGVNHEKLSLVCELTGRPQMFFRIGYPEKNFKHSPRFSSKEVTR